MARLGRHLFEPLVFQPLNCRLGEFRSLFLLPYLRCGFHDSQGTAILFTHFGNKMIVELVNILHHFRSGDERCNFFVERFCFGFISILVQTSQKFLNDGKMILIFVCSIGKETFIDKRFDGRIVASRPDFFVHLPNVGSKNKVSTEELRSIGNILISVFVFRISRPALGLLKVEPRDECRCRIPDDAKALCTGIDGTEELVRFEDAGMQDWRWIFVGWHPIDLVVEILAAIVGKL
mmetsp:Transcript_1183/g.2384  ORF Transcript_1183/g.2384 Transcript_1183/m.2384 type:complete len:235 (-) Transcript_1183:201-905(-)